MRRGVSVRGCTEYAVGIGFTLRYNGRLATLPQHAPTCVVQAERTVRILIRTCYATVQRTNKAQFRDLVAGARICVRSIEFHGPGCHDDFALNVYAYRNGTLVGDTFVGFTLRVPNV